MAADNKASEKENLNISTKVKTWNLLRQISGLHFFCQERESSVRVPNHRRKVADEKSELEEK